MPLTKGDTVTCPKYNSKPSPRATILCFVACHYSTMEVPDGPVAYLKYEGNKRTGWAERSGLMKVEETPDVGRERVNP